MRMREAICLALALAFAEQASAQDVVAEVRPGYETWRCAVLADLMRDKERAAILFALGHEALSPFAEAVHAGALVPADLETGVPSGVSRFLGGPSAAFDLGAIWGGLVDSMEQKHLFNATRSIPYDPQEVVRDAGADYEESGCREIAQE